MSAIRPGFLTGIIQPRQLWQARRWRPRPTAAFFQPNPSTGFLEDWGVILLQLAACGGASLPAEQAGCEPMTIDGGLHARYIAGVELRTKKDFLLFSWLGRP